MSLASLKWFKMSKTVSLGLQYSLRIAKFLAWNWSELRLGFRLKISWRLSSLAAMNWLPDARYVWIMRRSVDRGRSSKISIWICLTSKQLPTVCWSLIPHHAAPVGQPEGLQNSFCVAVNPHFMWIVKLHLGCIWRKQIGIAALCLSRTMSP